MKGLRAMDLAEFVRARRDAQGWSQKQLAVRAQRLAYPLSKTRVSQIESGSLVAGARLIQLAHALGVPQLVLGFATLVGQGIIERGSALDQLVDDWVDARSIEPEDDGDDAPWIACSTTTVDAEQMRAMVRAAKGRRAPSPRPTPHLPRQARPASVEFLTVEA